MWFSLFPAAHLLLQEKIKVSNVGLSPPGSVWHHREGISLVWSSGREIKCFQVLKMLLVAPLKTLGCYTLTNVSLTSACDLIFKSPDTFLFSWFFVPFCFCLFFPWKRTLDQQKHLVFFFFSATWVELLVSVNRRERTLPRDVWFELQEFVFKPSRLIMLNRTSFLFL